MTDLQGCFFFLIPELLQEMQPCSVQVGQPQADAVPGAPPYQLRHVVFTSVFQSLHALSTMTDLLSEIFNFSAAYYKQRLCLIPIDPHPSMPTNTVQ